MMKIGFITTIYTNIGDDFIRTGIENIITSLKDSSKIKFTYVNKHKPETAILDNSPIHFLNKAKPFRSRGFLMRFYDKYLYHLYSVYKKQDLIIQSGAPVLWPNCQNNEWASPIWYKTIGKLYKKIPVVNLAAGSCYPWENKEGFFSDSEKKYASDIGGFCQLTTTRDLLAHNMFLQAGVKNLLMPCTAFFVDQEFENSNKREYILFNYMEGAGHFDWEQNIDKEAWENTVKELIKELKPNHEIRFMCHSEKEVLIANKIAPDHLTYFPKTVPEYLEIIRKAKLGINNRMHASVAMGSVGVPAISICTDTRLLMLEQLGMPIWYVKDVTTIKLIDQINNILNNLDEERERLFELKKTKFQEYQKLLKPFVTEN